MVDVRQSVLLWGVTVQWHSVGALPWKVYDKSEAYKGCALRGRPRRRFFLIVRWLWRMYTSIDFLPMNFHVLGCRYTKFDLLTVDLDDGDNDVVSNPDGLPDSTGKDQHQAGPQYVLP